MDSINLGQSLIFMGIFIAAVGAVLLFAPHIPFLGKLPGDLSFGSGNIKVYFPLATCLLLSVVLTLVLNFLFGKK
jgi:hypothetical protein